MMRDTCSLKCVLMSIVVGHAVVVSGCRQEVGSLPDSPVVDSDPVNEAKVVAERQVSDRFRFAETWRAGSQLELSDDVLNEFVESWAHADDDLEDVNYVSRLSEEEFVALSYSEREALRPGLTERAMLLGAIMRASLVRADEAVSAGDVAEAERILCAVRNLAAKLNSEDALLLSRRIGRTMEERANARLGYAVGHRPDVP